MRFKSTKDNSPRVFVYDKRIYSCFLWLPLTIDEETRWLENVKFKQRYEIYPEDRLSRFSDKEYGVGGRWWAWVDQEWVDDGRDADVKIEYSANQVKLQQLAVRFISFFKRR